MNDDELKSEEKPKDELQNEGNQEENNSENTSESTVDEDLAGATEGLKDISSAPTVKPVKKKRFTKKKLLVAILILLVASGAAYWFLVREKDTTNTASQSQETSEQTTSDFTTPDQVIYSFREKETDPFTIYSRPVGGGERKQLAKLNVDEFIDHADVRNNVITYSTQEGVFVSSNAGESFKQVVELKQANGSDQFGEQITSLKISTEATKVVFGLLPSPGGSNSVTAVDLNGSKKTELFKSDKAGIFIDGYSEKSNKIIYSEGCYNCDGNKLSALVRDLETNQTKALSDDTAVGTAQDVTNDLSETIVTLGTLDSSVSDGIELNFVAPYTVSKINTESGDITTIATIGAAGEKNPNGTARSRIVLAGFLNKTDDSYYTDDKDLYYYSSQAANLMLTAENKISTVEFANRSLIVYSYGDPATSDFTLVSYDTASKKVSQILLGDTNTFVFGVTTK